MQNKSYLLTFLVIYVLFCCPPPVFTQQSGASHFFQLHKGASYVKGEVILKVKPEFKAKMEQNNLLLSSIQKAKKHVKIAEIKQMYPKHSVVAQAKNAEGLPLVDLSTIYNIKFDEQIPVDDAINALWTEDAFEFIEPRYIAHPFIVPNDPLFTNLDPGGYAYIQAFQAWDSVTGNSSVICGIVDVGYKFGVADLDPNLIPTPGEINNNGIDDDGNGYIDDYYGWDLADNDNVLNYTNNAALHGYEVARLYGHVTNNGLFWPGLSYNCGFRQIKTAPNANLNNITHGYEGIVYAADNGCHIINCSWGGPDYSAYGETVVNYATMNKKCAVVVAAGHINTDLAYYPAAYRNAISTTSVNPAGVVTRSYNYTVDISTPPSYYTSTACPVMSAATALAYRRFNQQRGDPTFTPYQAAQRVRVMAVDNYAFNPANQAGKLGKGHLDMFEAIKIATPMPSMRITSHTVNIIGDGDSEIETGETVNLPTNFINWLDATSNLTISLTPDAVCSPYITMGTSTYSPGVVAKLGTSSQAFSFTVNANAPADLAIGIRVNYTDPIMGYTDFEYIVLNANTNSLTITNNLMDMSVSGLGNWGFKNYPSNTIGIGVQYNTLNNCIYEGGFLIGKSGTLISNNIRKEDGTQDMDFSTKKRMVPNASPQGSDFEANGYFADTASTSPLGVKIKYNVYNYSDGNNDDYQIFEYLITNSTASSLTGLYAAIFADWDVISNPLDPIAYSKNRCSYDISKKWVYANQNAYSDYFAIALLTDEDFTATAYRGSTLTGTSFSDVAKFTAISSSPSPSTATIATDDDIMQFAGAGPFDIGAGQEYRIAFAVIGGNNLSAMDQIRKDAINNYFCQIVGKVPANTVSQTIRMGDLAEGDAEGWTHYYKIGTPNELLLSVKKDATVNFSPANVEVGYGGTPYYTPITTATAPYATQPSGWFTMNRYWNVSPSVQPATSIPIRTYFTPADFTALQSQCVGLASVYDLQFYKFKSGSGINPNPLLGHSGATIADLLQPSFSIGTVGNQYYAEMLVPSFSGGGGGSTGDTSPLPIEGLFFDALLMSDNRVKLSWTTEKEYQNAYYQVEKSLDRQVFENIGLVAAGNNANMPQQYQFWDAQPYKGINYYRLKQVDIDGNYTYSTVKMLLIDKGLQVLLYPNPLNDKLWIECNDKTSYVFIRIYDNVGRLMLEKEITATKDAIDVSKLSSGMYRIQVISDSMARTVNMWKE